MNPIAVDTASTLPKELRQELSALDSRLKRIEYFDDVERELKLELDSLLELLDNHLEERGVIAHHFTRAEPESIRTKGLITSTGADRRKWFLAEHGHRFTPEQLSQIRERYAKYFWKGQNAVRDGLIFFNLSKQSLADGDATPLLEYFGGETIYMPLQRIPGVDEILGSIGKPLVVSFKVQPSQMICSWTKHPAAIVWLSAYHASVNLRAGLYDRDVYVRESIPPQNIMNIEIIPA